MFNDILLAYIRLCFKNSWENSSSNMSILISSPIYLDFEDKCLKRYESIVKYMVKKLEIESTLEADLKL